MVEEIEIQTINDVKTIDYMRTTNDIINTTIEEQTTQTEIISEQLDNIQSSINNIEVTSDIDLNEVVDKIDNIDTTVIEAQAQDILSVVNQQQEQIDDMKENINDINDKLNQILERI